ncbi:PfkB family carbohydrate kinase [Methylocystis heyeri]|uniref:Sugar kinase n=1 Tax=Methylocystis heyeri TaxID=391905 RepID=A0A6B8KAX7_9HYPH|nr:PfkB family carbohydrate kinase [Methylocystis heyeri]QGM44827.1 sugar kinase [Methylocystis heyeri]
MDALFIGHAYIDVSMIADAIPTGDEKTVAEDYAVSFGGAATTACFACAKLGYSPDLLIPVARDWLGHMFMDMADTYGIRVHSRRVARSSLSFIFPKEGSRSILRARDDHYQQTFPRLDLSITRLLHLDGHMGDAALHYAQAARERGVIVSLDGGALRPGIADLLDFVDVAIVSMDLCRQMKLSEAEMLAYLKKKGCRIGGVTNGAKGLLWYGDNGEIELSPSLHVPSEKVIDTSGAGDIFHGAYCASYLDNPEAPWREHFEFARAASAHKVQHLGNEAGLPSRADIALAAKHFAPA